MLFSLAKKVNINNFGFVAPYDYSPVAANTETKEQLLAIVGDSFVEAQMVPYSATISGTLAAKLARKARVYPFAISGSPLSQYLAVSKWVVDTFVPDRLVVVVVGNDFNESLLSIKQAPGYHYFDDTTDGYQLVWRDFTPTLLGRLVGYSAMARFFLNNVIPSLQERRLLQGEGAFVDFVGYTRRTVAPEIERRSKRGVEVFLERLSSLSGLKPSEILILVDGRRPHLYNQAILESSEKSFFQTMRLHLMDEAKRLGFGVTDLEPIFTKNYAVNGQRFEFPEDGHWNNLGHALAAEAVSAWYHGSGSPSVSP